MFFIITELHFWSELFLKYACCLFWFRFCKDVVHLFILVGCYSDELSVCEGDVGHHPVASSDTNNVNLRLVFMEGIQHDLEQANRTEDEVRGKKKWVLCLTVMDIICMQCKYQTYLKLYKPVYIFELNFFSCDLFIQLLQI